MSTHTDDPYNLQRFVDAQEPVYDHVCAELEAGQKRTHWMWFIFPQIAGLGRSTMAMKYAISGVDEARVYLEHPILGERLRHCTRLVNQVQTTKSPSLRAPNRANGNPADADGHSWIASSAPPPRNNEKRAFEGNNAAGQLIVDIFGPVDAMKFRSSMTLFANVAEENEEFVAALQKYFGGARDEMTLKGL